MRTPHNRARRIPAGDHRGPQRPPLSLLVASTSPGQEHRQLAPNGRPQVAALIGEIGPPVACVQCADRRSGSHPFGRTPARKSIGGHLLRVGATHMIDGGGTAGASCPSARPGLVAGDHRWRARWRRSALLPHRTWRLLHAGVIASSALIRCQGIDI